MWRNTHSLVLHDMFSLMLAIGLDGTFLICANVTSGFSPFGHCQLTCSSTCDYICKKKKNAELAALSFRSEVSKLQLPGSTSAELQLSVGSRPGQRCCLDTQHDRCSPTGCAVTTPDKSKTILNIKVQNVFSDTSHSCMSFNASLSKINTELAGKVILTPF